MIYINNGFPIEKPTLYQSMNFLLVKKVILLFLLPVTALNLIILVMALTNPSSFLYPYRWIIGISFMAFGGSLRQHILSYNKTSKENS